MSGVPVPPACCTTSWDDGHPLDLRIAELLVKYGLQGTFYVPMQSERALSTPAQIRELSAAFEVGAHTVHHRDLTTLPADAARMEIVDAKRRVEDIIGKPCRVLCFPFGKYRRRDLGFARDAGYAGVRTNELMSLAFPYREDSVAVLPTTVQATPHKAWAYLRNACRRFAWRGLANYMLRARIPTWEITAQSFVSLVMRRGGVFHLWGHAWEVEEHNQWRQLEAVLRHLADYSSAVTSLTNSELCSYIRGGSKRSPISVGPDCGHTISDDRPRVTSV